MEKIQTFNGKKFKESILRFVHASEERTKDKIIKESLTKEIELGNDIYVYCPLMPITLTYFHLGLAEIISRMTKLGLQVIVNILDIPMMSHPIFHAKLRDNPAKSSIELVEDASEAFKQLVFNIGGETRFLHFTKFSKMLSLVVGLEKKELLHSLFKNASRVQTGDIQQYIDFLKERGWSPLSVIISDFLDIVFAQHLSDILVEVCSRPATMLLAGYPKPLIYTKILKPEPSGEIVGSKQELYFIYLPALPQFEIGKKFLDIDFPLQRIKEFVIRWLTDQKEKRRKKGKLQEVRNLYKYYFPLFLDECLYAKNDKIEKTPTAEFLKASKFTITQNDDILAECIVNNLHSCFMKALKSKREIPDEDKRTLLIEDIEDHMSKSKLKILALCDGTLIQSEIAKKCGLDSSTVSLYLKQLKEKGLVRENDEGRPITIFKDIRVNLQLLKFSITKREKRKIVKRK